MSRTTKYRLLPVWGLISAVVFTSLTPASIQAQDTKPLYNSNEVLVQYKKTTNGKLVHRSLMQKWNVTSKRSIPDVRVDVLEIPSGETVSSMMQKLSTDPNIETVQPNFRYYSTNFSSEQWGYDNDGQVDINLPEAHTLSSGSSNVIVGVLDGGMDTSHPDLHDAIWRNKDEIPGNGIDDDGDGYVDDVEGWNFAGHNASVFDPYEDDEHATHIAGVIKDIAPHAKIMPLKFIGPDGGSTADAIEAITYARKKGVRILNNSWGHDGFGSESDYLLEKAITDSGMLVVGAAGNDGKNRDQYPDVPTGFNSPNLITVAAVNRQGQLASFSAYGAQLVDIGAPGVDILSTVPDGGYAMESGTSMAAPFVSGTAALLFSIKPDLSPVQAIDILKSTAHPLPSLQGKTVSGGMVDAYAALQAVQPVQSPSTDGYTLLPQSGMNHVLHGKSWTITFSKPLANDAASTAHIRVLDEHNRPMAVTVEHGTDSQLIVTPVDTWKPNTTYYVFLESSLRSSTGQALKPGYFTFTTE